MKAFNTFLILTLLIPFEIFACGNDYEEGYSYTKADGQIVESYSYKESFDFEHGFNKNDLNHKLMVLEASIKAKSTFKLLSDYSLVLLKLGRTREAVAILEDLIDKHPREYNINANLGTAYELNGEPYQALKYIKKAVEINPESHNGSEWIHVKILEAKIQMGKDPLYLKNNSILGLDLDVDKSYSEKELAAFEKIKQELIWQLTERIAFVDAPDALVANLLADLGKLSAITDYLESSVPVYTKSLEYQPLNFHTVLSERDHLFEKMYWAKLRKYTTNSILTAAGLSVFIVLIRKWRSRRRARKQKAASLAEETSNKELVLS